LADVIAEQVTGARLDALGRCLELTEPLQRDVTPEYVTLSGGVAEYILGHERSDFGDVAATLGEETKAALVDRCWLEMVEAGQRIRAHVIGAAQFTVQVSGKTTHLSRTVPLPIRNVPVAHLGARLPEGDLDAAALASAFVRSAERLDLEGDSSVALAFSWSGYPTYDRLCAVARAVQEFDARTADSHRARVLLVVSEGDLGQAIGRILEFDLGLTQPFVSIDGIELAEFDFVDVGELIDPPGVHPVVIKSLLFPS
jgi:ethanolamine utilization protein EutA